MSWAMMFIAPCFVIDLCPALLNDSFLPGLQRGRVRVRQHVNPLSSLNQVALGPVDWEAIYEDCSRPLVVDLGCGYGRFLLLQEQKQRSRGYNYLGIEIRKLVRDASFAAPPYCVKLILGWFC